MDRHNGKYFTIVYGVYDKTARSLAYCNAGHPAALLFDDLSPKAPTRLESTDPMVGMLPPGMPFETKTVTVGKNARLLLYSDGVFEVERPGGGMWKFDEFVSFMAANAAAADLADRLYQHVRAMRATDVLNDDFSILDVRWS
jgi:sigma-B regulation protein RsbU (phosphoserine phosphatase)